MSISTRRKDIMKNTHEYFNKKKKHGDEHLWVFQREEKTSWRTLVSISTRRIFSCTRRKSRRGAGSGLRASGGFSSDSSPSNPSNSIPWTRILQILDKYLEKIEGIRKGIAIVKRVSERKVIHWSVPWGTQCRSPMRRYSGQTTLGHKEYKGIHKEYKENGVVE